MTLSDLQYLVAVAEEGSFGRAADRCHVSQPTLSGQIRKLEDRLGVTLFERRPRRVRPTAVGERIVDAARNILVEANRIVTLARQQHGSLCGAFRLGIIPTLGPYMLPWLVPALRSAYPETRLVVKEDLTASLLPALKAFELDALLLALPVGDGEFASLPLFDEPFVVACHRGDPLANLDAVAGSDLAGRPLILLNEGHCLRDQALAICGDPAKQVDRLREDFRAASLETARQMVVAGLGVTLLPVMAAGSGTAGRSEIAIRPFRAPDAFRRVGLLWRRSCPLAADMVQLAELILDHLPASVRTAPPASLRG